MKKLKNILVATTVAGFLVACGGGDDSSGSSNTSNVGTNSSSQTDTDNSTSTTTLNDITKGTSIKQNQKYKVTYPGSGTFMRKYVIENSAGQTCQTTVDSTTSVYNEYDRNPYGITSVSYGTDGKNASILVFFKYYTSAGSHLDFHVKCTTPTTKTYTIKEITGFNIQGNYKFSIDTWSFFKTFGIDTNKTPYVYYFQRGYSLKNLDDYYYSGLSIIINKVPTAVFDDRNILKIEDIDRVQIVYNEVTKKYNVTIYDDNKNILVQKEYEAPILEDKDPNYIIYLVKMKDKDSKPLYSRYSL